MLYIGAHLTYGCSLLPEERARVTPQKVYFYPHSPCDSSKQLYWEPLQFLDNISCGNISLSRIATDPFGGFKHSDLI